MKIHIGHALSSSGREGITFLLTNGQKKSRVYYNYVDAPLDLVKSILKAVKELDK